MLISKGQYSQAAKALDNAMAEKEEPHLYYLRAVVSYRLKNYEYAHEMVEHALFMKKEPDYMKLKALMLMETLDFEDALNILEKVVSIRNDAEAYFLGAVCMMFMDNPKSRDYLQLAYLADKKRTKEMIKEFYNKFFKNNKFLSENEKKGLAKKVLEISGKK